MKDLKERTIPGGLPRLGAQGADFFLRLSSLEVLARLLSPLGRLVTLDKVAFAAQFLCSNAAAGIVGETLVVDGGTRILVCAEIRTVFEPAR